MDLSSLITLIVNVSFTGFLIITGIITYRNSKYRSKKIKCFNMSNIFTTSKCAENMKESPETPIKYVEPYLKNGINTEFTTRECGL